MFTAQGDREGRLRVAAQFTFSVFFFFVTVQLQLLPWNKFLSVHSASFLLPSFYLLCFLRAEYLTQVDLEEKRDTRETNAKLEFDKGEGKGTTVPQLLENLSRPDQTPLSYCGGLEILLRAVTDCEWSSWRSLTQLPFSSNLFVPLFPQ